MTIKELKEIFPQDKYTWWGVDVNNATNNNYTEDDILNMIKFKPDTKEVTVFWKHKPKPTISKEKLDKVIECNRAYFKAHTGTYERDNAIEELNDAEEDCGEIKETGLLDIISPITLSTKAHDTPNETIYKVFEALGYEIK